MPLSLIAFFRHIFDIYCRHTSCCHYADADSDIYGSLMPLMLMLLHYDTPLFTPFHDFTPSCLRR